MIGFLLFQLNRRQKANPPSSKFFTAIILSKANSTIADIQTQA